MKIAIISDIHSNLAALQSVKADIDTRKVDHIVCLGDVVGYGPYPEECFKLVQSFCKFITKGNHEFGICDEEYRWHLNPIARAGVEFSARRISAETRKAISELPEHVVFEDMYFCHGSYLDPVHRYIQYTYEAIGELNQCPHKIVFNGHTHHPQIFSLKDYKDSLKKGQGDEIELDSTDKFMINVGSVGQPRDYNSQACYGIVETTSDRTFFTYVRVKYNIDETANKIREFNLPERLAERLYEGR
jgi:diadenosine tetraphosphatase ApaH/serine/threonine PP2A family protein phosphatase